MRTLFRERATHLHENNRSSFREGAPESQGAKEDEAKGGQEEENVHLDAKCQAVHDTGRAPSALA